MNTFLVVAIGLALAPASVAMADPCRAVSDEGWRPAGLAAGATFSGPVVHVIDGDSLCVAIGQGQDGWVEVRLADFYAPELRAGGSQAKSTLERLALGRSATCEAGATSYDRIVARCRIGDRPLGDSMRAAGLREAGNGTWRDGPTERAVLPLARPARATRSTAYGMSCPQLRAQGGARRGEPGYRSEWDGDGDGIACEPYRRR
jgi:micrococcal nuclease